MIGPEPFKIPERFEPIFWILDECAGVTQRPEYHPEGDVLTHSIQAYRHAVRESDDVDFILAALLHDVGKVSGRHGHDDISVELLDCHCSKKTLWLIKNHMRVHTWLNGEMRKLKKVTDLRNHRWFGELIHLARVDTTARKPGCKTERCDRQQIAQHIIKLEEDQAYGDF
jgi:hypothetical protein